MNKKQTRSGAVTPKRVRQEVKDDYYFDFITKKPHRQIFISDFLTCRQKNTVLPQHIKQTLIPLGQEEFVWSIGPQKLLAWPSPSRRRW